MKLKTITERGESLSTTRSNELIQDKGLQKMFYQRNDIPSADFLTETKEQILKYADFFPFFQKLRKGSYDGKGVTKLVNPNNLDKAFNEPRYWSAVDFDKSLSYCSP